MHSKSRSTRGRVHAALGTTIVIAVGFGVAVANGSSPAAPKIGSWVTSERPLARAVQPDQANALRVFARSRGPHDAMPAGARSLIGNSVHSGRNVELSRRVSTPSGAGWAIPGNGTVCLAVPDAVDGFGVSCAETSQARKRGVAVIAISPDAPQAAKLTMLSPTGSDVTAEMADGSTRELSADDEGVVSVTLTGATSVTVSSATGTTRMTIPAAPPFAAGDCPVGQLVPPDTVC